ncbi:MAG: cyclopropane-fatty-acyl-phospholipid synthase [candidate division Zixibacteria bacterium SM23_81]|nr:MAG: cyclopropane-fatty-acyl-phospholipid synthase [candidate division Zixibacteria bacterium SM23_81]
MVPKNEWEEFFDGHAPVYMQNPFTQNTLGEVDFILEELKLPKNSRILDMGCGTGRHAVELARRGYRVTGVDISSGMLAKAEKAARKAGVEVEWTHADATTFRSAKHFDAAICLCEGAFGLIGPKENPCDHDLAILRNIYKALKPGTRFILTALNGCRLIRKFNPEDIKQGRFDPLTMIEVSTMEYDAAEGKQTVTVREGGHVPSELVFLLRQAGFSVEHIGGGTAGNWGRRPLDLDEIEMMVIARKEKQLGSR